MNDSKYEQDLLSYARMIKKYCSKMGCQNCAFNRKDGLGCGLDNTPSAWCVPRGEKELSMTNREWLASMTTEELAEFIDENGRCDICPSHPTMCDSNCAPNIQDWLEAEHKENKDD